MAATILSAAFGNLVVAVALAAVALAAGRRAKWHAVARGAWLLVLVKLLTPPLVTVPVRCLPARPPAAAAAPDIAAPAAVPEPLPYSRVFAAPGSPAALDAPAAQAVMDSPPIAWVRRSVRWTDFLLAAWVTGAGAWAAVAALRVRRFTRLLGFASAAPPWLTQDAAEAARRVGLRR